MLNIYLKYLHEDDEDVKINPKRKTFMSVAGVANPADDIIFGLTGGATLFKASKDASKFERYGKKALGFGAGVVLGAAFVAGYRIIRSWFDKCTKQCGLYSVNTPTRQLCMLNCKRVSLIKTIKLLESNGVDNTKIEKVKDKLKVIDKKIILYKEYLKKNPEKKKE